jgi:hypothetical protein
VQARVEFLFRAAGDRRMLRGHCSRKLLENVWSAAISPLRLLILASLVVTSVGCGNILGIEDIESCWDATGFNGRGCWRTTGGCKLTKERIPNACTESACVPFDNAERLGLSSPNDLPTISAGPPGGTNGPGMGGQDNCPGAASNRVVVTGSNAIVPVLRYVSAELAGAQNPVTVLYQAQSSCDGANAIFKDVMVAGEFSYWTRDTNDALVEGKCTLPPQLADIGTCDVFATTCGLEDDAKVLDAQGPIQAMIFVAPKTSPERAISAEAARLVYGYEGQYKEELEIKFSAEPWTNAERILRRNPSSGTQNMIGAFIGVPSAKWVGVENTSTSVMKSALQMTMPADAAPTIGILDVVNGDPTDVRVFVRVLAFQATDQSCGFHPDSAEGKLDKRNVRDGHYALWGPIHVFSRDGAPTNVGNVVKFLTLDLATVGPEADQNISDLIKIVAGGSLVPSCAMQVRRDADGGALLPLVPARSCACFFDQLTTGESSCTPCATNDDCESSSDTPQCNFGFCERQ